MYSCSRHCRTLSEGMAQSLFITISESFCHVPCALMFISELHLHSEEKKFCFALRKKWNQNGAIFSLIIMFRKTAPPFKVAPK